MLYNALKFLYISMSYNVLLLKIQIITNFSSKFNHSYALPSERIHLGFLSEPLFLIK